MPFDSMNESIPFGQAKNQGDSYYTPEYVYRKLPIDWSNYKTAYEPSMGDGRILHFLEEQGIEADGGDILYGEEEDFFEFEKKVDLIITNPPFSKAQEFVEYALLWADTVIVLQQQNFLGSKKRFEFWCENPCDATFLLNTQVKFGGSGGGLRGYVQWYVWQKKQKHIKPGNWIYQNDGKTNYPK